MDGPYDPQNGHRFNKDIILSDPYAKAIGGRDVWRDVTNLDRLYPFRSRLVFDDFDWEEDNPLETPMEDLIIYEEALQRINRQESGTEARLLLSEKKFPICWIWASTVLS